MMDDAAKAHLHADLRNLREVMLWKLDGLGEYDVRRPLTATGTNLLGLVKHLAVWEARYFGEVFGRPFPERLPRWDDAASEDADLWATEHETREHVTGFYRRVAEHSDATITQLHLGAPGHVPWWRTPEVTLFAILVHLLTETSRHAGHADILREQVDGATGASGRHSEQSQDADFWRARCAEVERAAQLASEPTA